MYTSISAGRTALILILGIAGVPLANAGPAHRGGLDEAFAVLAAGPQALAWNPANLGLFPQKGVELLTVSAAVGNSAFSPADYNKYNGGEWSERDKQDILDQIGGPQLDVSARGQLSALGVSAGRFGFSIGSRGASTAAVPKDLIRLGLFGNPVGETFNLANVDGEGIAFTELRFSLARPVDQLAVRISPALSDWHAGLTLKLLHGWGYAQLLETSGSFTTTDEYITGSGSYRAVSATRGGGYGLDLGVAGRIGDRWVGSLAIRDLFARLSWSEDAEEHLGTFSVDELSLSDIDTDEEDEDLIEEDSQSYPIDGLRCTLPVVFAASGAYLGDRLLTTVYLEAATKTALGASSTPGLSLGVAWPSKRWYVLRGVAGLGGASGTRLAAGFGLGLGPVRLDLACRTWGTLNPFASKGIGVALGLGFVF